MAIPENFKPKSVGDRRGAYERIAVRMVDRFDANRDGSVTLVEIEGRQKKLFALLDVNDDGKIEPRELPAGKGKVRPNRN